MIPRTQTRKALGKASTQAAVEGLLLYGPHAVGLMIFAIPVLVIWIVSHGVFGVPSLVSAPGAGIAVGLKAGAPALMAGIDQRKRKDK